MNDQQNLSVSFTGAQLDYVYRALGRCPADEVEALRASIRQQIALAQMPPAAPEPLTGGSVGGTD